MVTRDPPSKVKFVTCLTELQVPYNIYEELYEYNLYTYESAFMKIPSNVKTHDFKCKNIKRLNQIKW